MVATNKNLTTWPDHRPTWKQHNNRSSIRIRAQPTATFTTVSNRNRHFTFLLARNRNMAATVVVLRWRVASGISGESLFWRRCLHSTVESVAQCYHNLCAIFFRLNLFRILRIDAIFRDLAGCRVQRRRFERVFRLSWLKFVLGLSFLICVVFYVLYVL